MSSRARPNGRGRSAKYRGVQSPWPVGERADALDPSGIDWSQWNKCPMCFSESGEPCMTMTVGGPNALPEIPMRKPHTPRTRRKQRPASAT